MRSEEEIRKKSEELARRLARRSYNDETLRARISLLEWILNDTPVECIRCNGTGKIPDGSYKCINCEGTGKITILHRTTLLEYDRINLEEECEALGITPPERE